MLRRERVERFYTDRQMPNSKSFLKREPYPEPKNPRVINSPSDASKAWLGWLVYLIDKKTFSSHPAFVKGSDPSTWPSKLERCFASNPVMETDFSSFEAHHRGVYSRIVYYWLMHMSRNVGTNAERRLISRLVLGSNLTVMSCLRARVDQRLMSGSLWTSSANGMLNLLIMNYLVCRTMQPHMPAELLATVTDQYFQGFVEGDDGICRDVGVSQDLIDGLGLKLEFERKNHFSDASFCGIVCDPSELIIVTDVLKVIRNFFVLPIEYSDSTSRQLAMLRAKAMSYSYLYKNCPVIGWLAYHVCFLTRGIDIAPVSTELNWMQKLTLPLAQEYRTYLTLPNISLASRHVVERRFGFSVSEQIEFETKFCQSDGNICFDLSRFMNADDVWHGWTHVFTRTNPHDLIHIDTFLNDHVRRCVADGRVGHRAPEVQAVDQEYLAAGAPSFVLQPIEHDSILPVPHMQLNRLPMSFSCKLFSSKEASLGA